MQPTPTVLIGGKERPVRFGFSALAIFAQETDTTLAQMQLMAENMRIDHAIFLAYAGLKDGARYAGEAFTATPPQVGDWLDDNPEALEQIMSVFDGQSNGAPAAKESDDKKK